MSPERDGGDEIHLTLSESLCHCPQLCRGSREAQRSTLNLTKPIINS